MVTSWLALTLLCAPAPGEAAPPFPLDRKDPVLQENLVDGLERVGLSEVVRGSHLAVAVVDLTHDEPSAYAGVNDDLMLYAASLPKIALLLAVVQAAEDGRRPLRPGDLTRLQQMITVSDNVAASWAYDAVGPAWVATTLQRPEYGLYEAPSGGLWVGRPYRSGGPENREPLLHLSHAATARQAARFYVLLQARRLVSPYWSERMESLMGPPGHHHKFVGALEGRPGLRFVARKSGSWSCFHADSALIEHYGRRYVLVALSDSPAGETLLRTLAPMVDDLILQGAHRARS